MFQHCRIEYTAEILVHIGRNLMGAIFAENGRILVDGCSFRNNLEDVAVRYCREVLIKNSRFDRNEGFHPTASNSGNSSITTVWPFIRNVLIAGNDIEHPRRCVESGWTASYVVFNTMSANYGIDYWESDVPAYCYGNTFLNETEDISGESHEAPLDTLYVKNNLFDSSTYGIWLDNAYFVIEDNTFNHTGIRNYTFNG